MLPETYYVADARWIENTVAKLQSHERKATLQKYSAAYVEAWNAEPVEAYKEERARFSANTRLREYVKRRTGR